MHVTRGRKLHLVEWHIIKGALVEPFLLTCVQMTRSIKMSIDKSWTSISNRLSKEYLDGVKMFISRVETYVNEDGKVRCPCRKCLNLYWHTLRVVHNHLIDKGFQ